MKTLVLFSSISIAAMPSFVNAADVCTGCASPAQGATHHTFYVDPVKGSKTGDGSLAKPWLSLATVLSTNVNTTYHDMRTFRTGDVSFKESNPKAPVRGGDTILLMSGNYGAVTITDNFNTDFITIAAAPGQKPVFTRLSLVSAGKWRFQGISFQSTQPVGYNRTDGLVDIGYSDWLGQTNNIILDNVSVSSTDDTSSWTPNDWRVKPYTYGVFIAQNSNCISIVRSHFYNLMNAINVAGDNSVISDNLIEKMSNDGIDIMASGLQIARNTIKDGTNDTSVTGLHPDGIQGWSLKVGAKTNTNTNVTIDSNFVIKTGDPSKTYMQGISVFDGLWDGLKIINNVVAVNTFQGIAVYGTKNTDIVNNTVIATDPTNHPTWILANTSKAGVASSGVTIRNNLVTTLQIVGDGAIADHNIAASGIVMPVGGKIIRAGSGTVGTKNQVSPQVLTQFYSLNAKSGAYDLRLKPGSVARDFGTAANAPTVDIVGNSRKSGVDVGAYNNP